MLFIVNNYDFINFNNRGGLEQALILINPQKQCKEVVNLTYRKCRKFYLYKIYKNNIKIFLWQAGMNICIFMNF